MAPFPELTVVLNIRLEVFEGDHGEVIEFSIAEWGLSTRASGSYKSGMNWVKWFLGGSAWQGLAGIAQITAAVLTIIAVWQARRMLHQGREMLNQGEKVRLASVAPEGEIANYPRLEGAAVSLARIDLQNVGWGPARNFSVTFESKQPASHELHRHEVR